MSDESVEQSKSQHYPAKISFDEEDRVYVAEFFDLPGCSAYGDTVEEAYRRAEEAQKEWMRVSVEQGLPIPKPSKTDEYSGRLLVRLPSGLHAMLADRAKLESGVREGRMARLTFDEWADKVGYGLQTLKTAPRYDAFQGWHARDAEVAALEAEIAAWKKAVEGLTPSGSEFVNDPEACASYIRKRTEYPRMIIDMRAEIAALKASVQAEVEAALRRAAEAANPIGGFESDTPFGYEAGRSDAATDILSLIPPTDVSLLNAYVQEKVDAAVLAESEAWDRPLNGEDPASHRLHVTFYPWCEECRSIRMAAHRAKVTGENMKIKMHVYQSDGASRDPSCKVCGLDSWDGKICFESDSEMRLKREVAKLKRQLTASRAKNGQSRQ